MSHSGAELLLRNVGPDCMLPALAEIHLLDARKRVLPAIRRAPVGMHPGPVMMPVRLGHGQQIGTALRWVSGPVYSRNRHIQAAAVTVRIGRALLRARLVAVLYGPAGEPVPFNQEPLRAS
jgi:hypothetical protein